MNRHLAIKTSCFCVVKLRNSLAITCVSRLESVYLTSNLFDPDLIRSSLREFWRMLQELLIDLINNYKLIVNGKE